MRIVQKRSKNAFLLSLIVILSLGFSKGQSSKETNYWMKIRALNKFERSVIESTGISIELAKEDYIIAYGSDLELEKAKKLGWLISSSPLLGEKDFPKEDSDFHNYSELTLAMQNLAKDNSDIVSLDSIGKSTEGRELWHIRISTDLATSNQKPGVIFMGGHHAREHLSIDTPLRIMQNLISEYRANNPRIRSLIEGREIHFIPCVNPDGAEYDISGNDYKMWRKNRGHNKDGSFGVDLNRNYGFQWGTGGSSKDTGSDVYMGESAFSEKETQAVKQFIENAHNITTLLSFHTFSELVLYPWGHSYDPIANENDHKVYETMAKKMASWNGYTPQQSSELYIASGDTTDWAYGTQKIFAFTFELDPTSPWGGGFYPGQKVISEVVRKNTEPVLYLIDHADNPYRVLTEATIDK
jgi:carboxypeptidase T